MKRIIIADDSSTARMFIKKCMEISGLQEAEYLEASNGREAIELLKAAPADLLVTDLNMPEMDGLELLRYVKSSPRLHEIPVMVISSAANPKKVEELRQAQAFAILNKPISPATIANAMDSLLKDDTEVTP